MSFWDDLLNAFDPNELDAPLTIDFGGLSNIIDFNELEGNTLQRFLGNLDAGKLGSAVASLFTNTTGATGGLNQGLISLLGGLGGQTLGLFDPQTQKVGYTGGIPSYTAVRQQVPIEQDPNRRPGAGGRRYFTDTVYAQKPSGGVPSLAAAQQQVAQQAQQLSQQQASQAPAEPMAAGGIAALAKGRYLRGSTDGMEDKLDTTIEGKQPAKLSHGEFVVPADVVSHLGNGNSDAGAKQLYAMMDRIRQARTGTKKQGKKVTPEKYLPA